MAAISKVGEECMLDTSCLSGRMNACTMGESSSSMWYLPLSWVT